MIIVIGSSVGIGDDLNFIADSDTGVDFVDGKLMFMGTFYSPYTTVEIHEKLNHRPSFLLFDITNQDDYGVNLPSKYYEGLFKEGPNLPKVSQNKSNNSKPAGFKKFTSTEEYTSVNDILDKLSRNDYNRKCLTDNELNILNKSND
jgi:hypothetical protein